MKLKFCFTLALVTLFSATYAQTADEIINKYFEATGGLAKWRAIKSIKMDGKFPTPGGDFPVALVVKAPNKSKFTFNVQGKEIVQAAYDGTTGWTLNPLQGGVDAVKLDEEQTKELKEQEVEDALIDYAKKGHVVTLEGKEEIDGVQCYKLKLEKNKNNDKEDVTEIRYFDVENNVLIMTKSYIRTGEAKGTEVQSFVSDYQEVNGIMMPFSMEQKVNGNTMMKLVFDKIEINGDISDSVFAFPTK
jgi:outer membrane lipoprotein-sorting protein